MLKRPETYLLALLLLAILLLADTYRSPERQITGWVYIGAVRIYQFVGRPMLEGRVECRYQPTCSEFSIEAVQTHGIRHGLALTYNRINSCQTNVPRGTLDPVPPAF
jgi:putative membrane protein insertion efficiency factor